MAEPALRDAPAQLKAVQPYIRLATDIDRVNPIVSYWIRLFSIDLGLKTDKISSDSNAFLSSVVSWLEKFKQSHKDDEAVTSSTVGQAHFENFVIQLFNKADDLDRAGTADKTTVRMFYMASLLFNAMEVFGPLTEEIQEKAKYARYKAAYIQKCLKMGQTPVPGSTVDMDNQETKTTDDMPSTQSASVLPSQPPSATKKGFYLPEVPCNEPGKTDSVPSDSLPAGGTSAKTSTHTENTTPSCHSLDASISSTKFVAINGADLKPEDMTQAQKHCKFVISALQYDDIPTAVDYLQKALSLLTTGKH